MDDLYRENILDHYRHPRHKGRLEHPTHSFQDENPLCGDNIRIDLHVDENDVIDDVRFDGHGCSISLASASMLAERLKGMPLEEAKKLSKEDILEALGIELGPVRLKCALLSLKVLKGAIYGLPEAPADASLDEV
jgi:nitrogen fixation protein NifU and related proteins